VIGMGPQSTDVPDLTQAKKATSDALLDAITTFAANPTRAIRAIGQLHASDPSGLALAAVRMVLSTGDKSPGLQYLIGLVTGGSLLTDLFLNPRVLPLVAAVALARKLAALEPLLEIRLLRNAAATAGGDLRSTDSVTALRVLGLVDAISDCGRLSSYLVQFADHRDPKVRSKAALLLGRSNWNLTRIEASLASTDARLRANAVESLWGSGQKEVKRMLWQATEDPSGRVVVNALLGLCLAGDREAQSRLANLSEAADPVLRAGAAWAMGETADPRFSDVLEKLEQDDVARVRTMAENSRNKLRAVTVVPAVPETPVEPAPEEPDSEKPVTPIMPQGSYYRIG